MILNFIKRRRILEAKKRWEAEMDVLFEKRAIHKTKDNLYKDSFFTEFKQEHHLAFLSILSLFKHIYTSRFIGQKKLNTICNEIILLGNKSIGISDEVNLYAFK